MASIRELRGRIASLKNIEKITRAVKMVSVAKLRRAQDRVVALRPYANTMRRLLAELLANAESFEHSLTCRASGKTPHCSSSPPTAVCADRSTRILSAWARIARRRFGNRCRPAALCMCFAPVKNPEHFFSLHKYAIAGEYSGVFQNLQYQYRAGDHRAHRERLFARRIRFRGNRL